MCNTLGQLNRMLIAEFAAAVGNDEARAMTREVLHALLGVEPVDIALSAQRSVEPETVLRAMDIAHRVTKDGQPLQYVLGYAWFAGLRIAVNPGVLVPRPETAQLVDIIADVWDSRRDLRVLDVCTGSGCIAVALARRLPFSRVDAVDISPEAVSTARSNATTLKTAVTVQQRDALRMTPPSTPAYNIIVSNPPYIVPHESADMDARVLEHEPHLALFAPEDDPLVFYRHIARYASQALLPGGMLYFEINPLFAAELRDMLRDGGFYNVDILRDYKGRQRFATAQRQ